MDERIAALGDVGDLMDVYLKQNSARIDKDDCWNPAGFTVEHIGTTFGWSFKQVSKPTLEQLEEIKHGLATNIE